METAKRQCLTPDFNWSNKQGYKEPHRKDPTGVIPYSYPDPSKILCGGLDQKYNALVSVQKKYSLEIFGAEECLSRSTQQPPY